MINLNKINDRNSKAIRLHTFNNYCERRKKIYRLIEKLTKRLTICLVTHRIIAHIERKVKTRFVRLLRCLEVAQRIRAEGKVPPLSVHLLDRRYWCEQNLGLRQCVAHTSAGRLPLKQLGVVTE